MHEARRKATTLGQTELLASIDKDLRVLEPASEPAMRVARRTIPWLLLLAALSALGASPGRHRPRLAPTFTDVASSAGIRFRHLSGSPEKNYIFEAKGGGVCLLDYDGDGCLDIYFVNGNTLEDVQRGVVHPSALYRANRDGTYTDVTTSGRRRRPRVGAWGAPSATSTTTGSPTSTCSG